jgi:2-aminoethylphosphonate-pyruvate transaminase
VDAELVLLNPGPARTSQRVRQALLRGDLCHREPEFAALLLRLRTAVARAVAPEHETVLLTGSGTAAMEAALLSAVRPGRSVLVVTNGSYGERFARIASAHGIVVHEVCPPGDLLTRWTTPVDPAEVSAALAAHSDVDAVVCVQHETTTGLLNPVAEIGAVVARTDALFVIDAISATGNEELDLSTVDFDLAAGTANKGLHGLPGISFVLLSNKALDRGPTGRGHYLDLWTHLGPQRRGEVVFTPAVQVCYAFDEALAEYFEGGGQPARSALYRRRAELVRAGFARLGLQPVVAPEFRALSVSTLPLPEGVSYPALHDELKARGYVIYAGQGALAADHFRICTFGEIPWDRLRDLEGALDKSIAACRSAS